MTHYTPTPTKNTRRQWLAQAMACTLAGPALTAYAAAPTPVEVWKDPNCGCCQDWVDHMQAHGFAVTIHATGNNAVRARLGLPQKLGSCTPRWWAATWWKAMCPPVMCAHC